MRSRPARPRAWLGVCVPLWAAAATGVAAQDRGTWIITDQDGNVTQREPLPMTTVDVGLPVPLTVETEVLGIVPATPVEMATHSEALSTHRDVAPFDGAIHQLFEDAGGRLWMRASPGLLAYQGDGEWVVVDLGSLRPDRATAHPDGSVWAVDGSTVARIDEHGITVYESPHPNWEACSGIGSVPDGDVWVLCASTARYPSGSLFLRRYDGNRWSDYLQEDGLPLPGWTEYFAVDAMGTVWLSRNQVNPRLISFDGETWTGHRLPITGGGPMRLHLDGQGRLWVSNATQTFIRATQTFVRDGTGWSMYDPARWSSVRALTVDSEGGVWINGGNEVGALRGTSWTYLGYDAVRQSLGAPADAIRIVSTGALLLSTQEGASSSLVRWQDAERATAVEGWQGSAPVDARLQGNYPNPFNARTQIGYWVPRTEYVRLAVLSVTGQLVRTLQHGLVERGGHVATWDGQTSNGQAAASGVYLYAMSTPGEMRVGKMALLR